jgi:hypothetical protein
MNFKDFIQDDKSTEDLLGEADRTGISIYVAAGNLFDQGHSAKNVEKILKKLKQPTEGYVYADEVPGFSSKKPVPIK